jgi:glycosyltransferase involved in cell wall biosynthesis
MASPAPSVDVVIPAYKAERFIGPAIESVLAQRGVATRILVVDDGSPDGTADAVRAFGEAVTLISQPNSGVARARNNGFSRSTAPYVALLDSDDVWRPDRLREQVALLERHPEVGLVFGDMTIFDGDFHVLQEGVLRATPGYAQIGREPLGGDAFLLDATVGQILMRDNFISPSTVLLRREAIVRAGGFDEAFVSAEDLEFFLRVLRRWRAIVVERSIVWSRQWGGNKSTNLGRVNRARVQMSDKVFAYPDLYPDGAVEYFRTDRPRSLMRLGREMLGRGEVREARAHLLGSFRSRPGLRSGLLLASTLLPQGVRDLALRTKRALRLRLPTRDDRA